MSPLTVMLAWGAIAAIPILVAAGIVHINDDGDEV